MCRQFGVQNSGFVFQWQELMDQKNFTVLMKRGASYVHSKIVGFVSHP